jgi:hypothetical protein
MTRRFWLKCFAWSIGWFQWAKISGRAGADEQQATLNELLRSVLKCRRPEEFAYVNLVTAKVNSGELPVALVLSMMDWARKRSRQEVQNHRRNTDIPFPYFQEGLRLRAAEIGVSLPAFST